MPRDHHVYSNDMSLPSVQKPRGKGVKKKCSGYLYTTMNARVPLLVSSEQTHPRLCEFFFLFFPVVTALTEKNAGKPNFPPPFVSPLP